MFLGKKPLAPYIGGISDIVKNKFVIVLALFVVWITFFDKHSLITNYKLSEKLEALEKENRDYQDKITATKTEIKELNQDLEKFAREKYYFQKENEDVFVVVKK